MAKCLKMRYLRARRIPSLANSERAIVQRGLSSQLLLEQLEKGYRYITVDETFIDTFGYERQSWAFQGEVCRRTSVAT